jgi:DNA-directed RNA polymerase subunit RPC12/RpoP
MKEHYFCIDCEKIVEPVKTRDEHGYPVIICPENRNHELEERSARPIS